MKSNGGFILIKINKPISNIIADDFDKKVFREIVEKHIQKPLILESKDDTLLFSLSAVSTSGVFYDFVHVTLDENLQIDGYTRCNIGYNYGIDTITFRIEEN